MSSTDDRGEEVFSRPAEAVPESGMKLGAEVSVQLLC
jgi:hypothetical protein